MMCKHQASKTPYVENSLSDCSTHKNDHLISNKI